ncbi:MAG: esterase family protein [Candidatus Aminicenantes bacterium]|nr:esterase family protein [Candidatus Aminicenantes bacterium]
MNNNNTKVLIRVFLLPVIIIFLNLSCYAKDFTGNISFSEIKRPYTTIGPYISSLLKLRNEALETKTQKFWNLAKEKGLPFIEEDPLDENYKFVTLVYQNSEKNKDITFEVKGIYDEYRFGDMKLRQLGKTDLYYRCYKVPNDICFSYRFNIKDIVTGKKYKNVDKYNSDRIPKGEIHNFTFSVLDLKKSEPDWNKKRHTNLNSRLETFKYKVKALNEERNIYVYLPPDYDKNRKDGYPVIYLFDSFIYLNRVEVPNILDNLIVEGKIEPMIAVLFGTYRRTRDIILPLNFEFRDEFVSDFLPIIRKNYNTSLKPENNIIGGMSYGGLAAAFIGLYHPEIFGKILSQSGSFWRGLELTDKEGTWIRKDWLINKYLIAEKMDLKLYLDWGLQENFVLGSNRKMVRVLTQKGYDLKFVEFNGWHDWSNSRKTFPEGLLYLLK